MEAFERDWAKVSFKVIPFRTFLRDVKWPRYIVLLLDVQQYLAWRKWQCVQKTQKLFGACCFSGACLCLRQKGVTETYWGSVKSMKEILLLVWHRSKSWILRAVSPSGTLTPSDCKKAPANPTIMCLRGVWRYKGRHTAHRQCSSGTLPM